MQLSRKMVFVSMWLATMFCLPAASHGQSQRSSEARDRLESAYPGIEVRYFQRDAEGQPVSWAGAEQVTGRLMPASGASGRAPSETPEEALADWLASYGDVFQGDGQIEPLDVTITATMPLRGDRVAIRFEQRLVAPDDPERTVAPRGVHGRALIASQGGGWAVSHVAFAPVDEPTGGTPGPIVSSEQALIIASTESQAARSGMGTSGTHPFCC